MHVQLERSALSLEESVLIQQAQKGDNASLSILLQQNYSFLYKYLLKISLHTQTAEDITQETIMKAIEKISMYNGTSKFSSWLITIGTRILIDQKRKLKRESSWIQEEQVIRKLKWQFTQSGHEWPEIMDYLSKVPEEMRIPIILKHYYGYAYDEICKMLSIPEGTVKSRIHNGIKLIRKGLQHHA